MSKDSKNVMYAVLFSIIVYLDDSQQSYIEKLRQLIVTVDGQNPYRDGLNKAKEKMREAQLTNRDGETLRTLEMEVWAFETNYDEWHGKNVLPIEWQVATVKQNNVNESGETH